MWLGPADRMGCVWLGRDWTGADRSGSERQGLGLIVVLHSCAVSLCTVVWMMIMRMIRLCRLNSRRLLHPFAISWLSVFCLSVCLPVCLPVCLSVSLSLSLSLSLCESLPGSVEVKFSHRNSKHTSRTSISLQRCLQAVLTEADVLATPLRPQL